MPKKTEHKRISPSEQTDLWEHACLLFHSFEWQDAADTFNYLRQTTSDSESQAFCFLNAGLILARLGDFTYAHQAFDHALRLDKHEPITHFLLGLIEAETGDSVRAQARFEMCLEEMVGVDTNYRDRRLDFVLTLDAVRSNASAMWMQVQSQYDAGRPMALLAALERLPVEVLFEAPPRLMSGIMQERHLRASDDTDRHFHHSYCSTDANSEADENPSGSARSSERTARSLKSIILRNAAPVPSSRLSREALSSNLEPPDLSLPVRILNRNFAPRDARVVDESMKELSSFIRHAGPATGGREVVTIDRDYMVCLLQNDVGRTLTEEVPAELQGVTRDRIGRDGIDSVLDLYARSSNNLATGDFATSQSAPEPDSPLADHSSPFPPLRPQASPAKSTARTKSIPRKPVPSRAAAIPRSVPIIADHTTNALPDFSAQATFDPHPGTPYLPSTSEVRRASHSTAERWLRKEVIPPWACRRRLGGTAQAGHDKTPSNDDSEGVETLPSTVSSMDIFSFGLRGRGRMT